MITCEECKKRLLPDNPEAPSGRYSHSTCDYFCDKEDYDRQIERAIMNIEKPEPDAPRSAIQQVQAELRHIRRELAKLQEKTRKELEF